MAWLGTSVELALLADGGQRLLAGKGERGIEEPNKVVTSRILMSTSSIWNNLQKLILTNCHDSDNRDYTENQQVAICLEAS
jgi:hypothetical protein